MIEAEYFMEYLRKRKVMSDVLLAPRYCKYKWRTKEYSSFCGQKLKAFFKILSHFVN